MRGNKFRLWQTVKHVHDHNSYHTVSDEGLCFRKTDTYKDELEQIGLAHTFLPLTDSN